MPDNWIGHIKMTNETEIVDNNGVKLHDYLLCDGSGFDGVQYSVLAAKLASTNTPNMTSPDPQTPYKIIA